MPKHWTIIHIRNGEIQTTAPISKLCTTLKDGKYLVEINAHNKRSNPQNRYYRGVCVQMVRRGMLEMGNEFTDQEVHEFLKSEFNSVKVVNTNTGEVKMVPRSTTLLNKEQFSEYIEKIQRFAAEFLGIIIPDPGIQLKAEL